MALRTCSRAALSRWSLPPMLCFSMLITAAPGEDWGQSPKPIASQGDLVRTEIPYRGSKVVLVSEFQERITKSRYRAKGKVEIAFEDSLITCEEAEYDEESGEGVTYGTTRFSQGKQWLTCSRAEFNLSDRTGTFYDASGFTDQEFLVRGKTIVKTGADTYHVQSSFVTTCQDKRPKWAFRSSSSNIRVDHTARLRHMVFKIKGVPVLYFPYVILPLEKKKRSSGFLPFHTGSSTTKGRVFTLGYYQTLGQSADATVYEEYYTLRGFGIGGIFRARPNPTTHLYLQAFGIKDKLNQGGAHLVVDGESLLPNGFRAVAKVNITSNFQFRQAFADTFRSATIPLENSTLFLTRNLGSYSTNFSFEREEVNFPGRSLVIRRLPSLEFSSLGQPLGKTPFVLYFNAALEGFSRKDSLIETPSMVQRLDFYPRIAVRLPAFAGFSLIPTVGFRETYYSSRTDGQPSPQIMPAGLNRRYAEFELNLQTPVLEKQFKDSWLGNFRHVIEPAVTYRRIHGIDNLQETLRFDETDAIADTSEIEYGIANRIFKTRKVSPGNEQDYEFLYFAVMQKYYFDPDFGGAFRPGEANIFYPLDTLTGFSLTGTRRNLSPASLIARVSPTPGISYDVRADFDMKAQRLRDASVSTYWQQNKVFVAGTYFKTQALEPGTFDSHHIQGLVGYGSPLRGFSASMTLSYNLRNDTLLNSHSRVNYMWDCCGVSMEFQQWDLGLRTESRINFSFTLKGIGSFGNIKRPESLF